MYCLLNEIHSVLRHAIVQTKHFVLPLLFDVRLTPAGIVLKMVALGYILWGVKHTARGPDPAR